MPDQPLITGVFLVETLLRHGRVRPAEVAVVKGGSSRGLARIVKRAESTGVPVRWVGSGEMRALAGDDAGDVAAVLAAREACSVDALLDEGKTTTLLLALEGVEDPHNVGAILRTAWAARVDGIILESHARDLPRDLLARSSAGASECLPVVFADDLSAALKALDDAGIVCAAAEAKAERNLFATELPARLCIVIGGEHRGLSRAVLATCALHLAIPMNDAVQSLPATAGAAVMLYEVLRRR